MSKKNGQKMSRSAFVRAQPNSLSTQEVVAKGRAAGLDITEKNVWAARYAVKHGKGPKKAGRSAKAAVAVPAPSAVFAKAKSATSAPALAKASGGSESQFLSLVLDLGLVRAERMLTDVRRRLATFTLS